MSAHVLMLSSSRKDSEAYLAHARTYLLSHLGECRHVLFVPFAAVTQSYDSYVDAVATAMPELEVTGIHTLHNPVEAIKTAKSNGQAILVGGGNTFHLLHTLYQQKLLAPIQQAVANGTPYIGWSAGSNICGQSIRTTNDMPIIEPESFNALNIVPFQLNPHYSDYHPPGHNGETRDQRLAEFTRLNPTTPVVAIREGTALVLSNQQLKLVGDKGGFVFLASEKRPIAPNDDLTELLNSSL